ncbi:MAG TPA: hypothetical protein VND64_12020 [Pirellulales bacterium]|nr:hypothetical protein [Pirellulales bacterium]
MNGPDSTNGSIPAWQIAVRLVWVVVQLSLVYALGATGAQFVYQGF